MNKKNCAELRDELLPGYALGALEPAEHAEADAHVAECPDCRSEAEQMADALHATLGRAVPSAAPSPLLRTQFLARLALEMGPVDGPSVPARPATPVPPLLVHAQERPGTPPQRRPFAPRWMMGAVAAPAALALALGVGFFNMQQQLADQQNNQLSSAFSSPHMTKPLAGPAAKQGMAGEVIMPTKGTASLVIVSGMPRTATGITYTCWLHMNGHWTAGGTLRPDASGIAMIVLDRTMDLHRADRVSITEGGTTGSPAGAMLLGTTL